MSYLSSSPPGTHGLTAAFTITLIVGLLAASRRYYVRITKLASSGFLVEDYVFVVPVACFIAFTALCYYICVTLRWGQLESQAGSMETIWRCYYAASLLMDVTMTLIRLDLFLFYRRVYTRVNSSCRQCLIIFMAASVAYLLACVLARTLFCTPKAGLDFTIYSSQKCNDMSVRLSLATGDLLLNIAVVGLVTRTVRLLRGSVANVNKSTGSSGSSGGMWTEASKPCRPMLLVAFISCTIPIIRLAFAASPGPEDYGSRIRSLICSHVEATMFFIVACMPTIRTLLFPGLTCPASDPRNPRNKYTNSKNSDGSKSFGKKAFNAVMVWTLTLGDDDDTMVSQGSSEGEKEEMDMVDGDRDSKDVVNVYTAVDVNVEEQRLRTSGGEFATGEGGSNKSVDSLDWNYGNSTTVHGGEDLEKGDVVGAGLHPARMSRS